MKKYLRIGVAGVNHLSGNRGVGALAISTFYLLRKSVEKEDCKIDITAIGCNFGKSQLSIGERTQEVNNILTVSVFSFRNIIRLLTNPKLLLSFLEYLKLDVILCMGEGDSFSDIYGKRRFDSINDQHKMARLFRKKYILLPQTIGPFKDLNHKKSAIRSIEKSHCILVRDRLSFDYVRNNSKQQNLRELIDVAFFMPFTKKVFRNERVNVGLNISALMWHGGYTRNNQFGFQADYKQLVRKIIDFFISQPEVQLHLVAHVVNSTSHIENDYEVSHILQDEYDTDKITLAPFFLDPIDAKSYISGLDFFTGARMHACIAAFSSGVPVFPISYSRKFNGLFVNTLEYRYMGDLINQSTDMCLEELVHAFEQRLLLEEKIKMGMEKIVTPRYTLLMDGLRKNLGL